MPPAPVLCLLQEPKNQALCRARILLICRWPWEETCEKEAQCTNVDLQDFNVL